MQITEALISEPGDIRRFIQQAVDHWPHLLAFYFTLHSAEGNINGQQIHAFCTSFYRQVHERITERNHTASPSSPVVLRWLREQHGGATIRCLLLFSQELFCHPSSIPRPQRPTAGSEDAPAWPTCVHRIHAPQPSSVSCHTRKTASADVI